MRQLTAFALTNQNITAAQNVASYTAEASRMLFARLFAKDVAGSGVYTAYAGIHTGGSSPVYEMQPRTTPTVATGVTAIGLSTIPIPVASGEVFKVYLQGLAADSSTPDINVDIWDDGPLSITLVTSLVGSPQNGASVVLRRGDTLSWAIAGLGSITGYTSLWITVKAAGVQQADSQSLFQIKKNASGSGDGLLYANGATASDATKGSITIDSAASGDITIALDESITDDFAPGDYVYDIQVLNGGTVTTLSEGAFKLVADVTQAIA